MRTSVSIHQAQAAQESADSSKNAPNQSPIEFTATPSSLKIPANGNGILNVATKLKNSYQLMNANKDEKTKSQSDNKAEKYHHLLIAKVKDTQLMFSYIIEASLIKSSGGVNSLS